MRCTDKVMFFLGCCHSLRHRQGWQRTRLHPTADMTCGAPRNATTIPALAPALNSPRAMPCSSCFSQTATIAVHVGYSAPWHNPEPTRATRPHPNETDAIVGVAAVNAADPTRTQSATVLPPSCAGSSRPDWDIRASHLDEMDV